MQKINLPRDRFCAVVLRTDSQPERRETVQSQAPVSSSNNTARPPAAAASPTRARDGGSVTIGDVRGSNDIAIDASGGNANADASGWRQQRSHCWQPDRPAVRAADCASPARLTMIELEGNVVLGKPTTYWLDTEAGRRPAAGPTLLQVADGTVQTGTIIVDTGPVPPRSRLRLTTGSANARAQRPGCSSVSSGETAVNFPATASPDPEGRVRFANLPAGTRQEVRPEGTSWCHAESDHVDAITAMSSSSRSSSRTSGVSSAVVAARIDGIRLPNGNGAGGQCHWSLALVTASLRPARTSCVSLFSHRRLDHRHCPERKASANGTPVLSLSE